MICIVLLKKSLASVTKKIKNCIYICFRTRRYKMDWILKEEEQRGKIAGLILSANKN